MADVLRRNITADMPLVFNEGVSERMKHTNQTKFFSDLMYFLYKSP